MSISVQPATVRLVDQTEGRVHLLLDNTSSNYPRTVTLTGADDQAALEFQFSPRRLEIGPGRTGQVEVWFGAPQIPEASTETHTATLTATDGTNTTQARLTINQQRSTLLPLRLRLEPTLARVKGRHPTPLRLFIDNRNGHEDRHIDLEGRDPEAAIRFWFEQPSLTVPAGAAVTVPMSVSAPKPAITNQTQRPFRVIAVESNRETEATGTLEHTSTPNRARPLLIGSSILLATAATLVTVLWFVSGGKPTTNTATPPATTTPQTTPPTTPQTMPPSPASLPGTDAQVLSTMRVPVATRVAVPR